MKLLKCLLLASPISPLSVLPVYAEQIGSNCGGPITGSNCGSQVAIYLIPTTESWNKALSRVKGNQKLSDAVKANKLWGAQDVHAHITMTSYAPPSNSKCKAKQGNPASTTVNYINQNIIPSGGYHLAASFWKSPSDDGSLTLFSIQGSHATLDKISKELSDKGFYCSKSLAQMHVSFVKNQALHDNSALMKDFLGDLRWVAAKMCANSPGLAKTARKC